MSAKRLTLLTLLPLLCLGLLVGRGSAQLLDAVLAPRDRFAGEIETTEDLDLIQFDSVQGALVTLTVVPLKGSALSPLVTLTDTSTDEVVVVAQPSNPKKRKLVVKNLELPSTGTYELSVSGVDESVGGYQVAYVERLPKALTKAVVDLDLGAGETVVLPLEVASGLQLSAKLARLGKSDANPAAPLLADPDDEAVDLGDSLTAKLKPTGDRYQIKQLTLDHTGTYSLSVTNTTSVAGQLRLTTSLKRAPVQSLRLDELGLGEVLARTLSGTVLAATDGFGLAGVTVSIEGGPSTETDEQGNFVLQDPPEGELLVSLDGSTFVNGPPGASFGQLIVPTDVAAEGASLLPRVIVLPDLANPDSANQAVGVDGNGGATEAIDLENPADDIDLRGPLGTLIRIGGVLASEAVALNATPVQPDEVPMPLTGEEGAALDASSYLTVQPPEAGFDTSALDPGVAAGPGLTAIFPNDRGFPIGMEVDIWSFDHDADAWVNRSEQFGVRGLVVDDGMGGSYIEAPGLIIKGGWHAPVIAVDPDKATTLRGRVVMAGTSTPIPGTSVATSLGQFAQTDAAGVFEIEGVPAYAIASLPACVPIDIGLVLVTPVAFGAERLDTVVLAGSIVNGEVSELGDIGMAVPDTGSLVGLVLDDGQPVQGAVVALVGATAVFGAQSSAQRTTNAAGQFFATGLAPGSWTAGHTFAGDSAETKVAFGIQANGTTALTLQRSGGKGKTNLTVKVIEDVDKPGEAPKPVSGAQVRLVSADSPAGIAGTTNALGSVTFAKVTAPFTITAQVDRVVFDDGQPIKLRHGATVYDIKPKTSTVSVPLGLGADDGGSGGQGSGGPPTASLIGSLANLPPSQTTELAFNVRVTDALTGEELTTHGFGWVDVEQGTFSADVRSQGNPWNVVIEQREWQQDEPSPPGFGSGPSSANTLAALLVTGVADPGLDGTVDLTLDWDDAIPFDNQLPLHFAHPLDDVQTLYGQVRLSGPGVAEVILGELHMQAAYGEALTGFPGDVSLFDVDHPALVGLDLTFGLEIRRLDGQPSPPPGSQGGSQRGSQCEYDMRALSTTSGISVDVPTVAAHVIDPAPDALLSPAEAQALVVHYDDGAEPKPEGLTLLGFFADGLQDTDLGVDAIQWEFYTRLGRDELALPPTTLPVFSTGIYQLELGVIVIPGSALDFDRFFDAALPANFQALLALEQETCSHFAGQTLFIEPTF